ncbi:uncharacterized protein BP01DRAFT_163888, partial [Aspergillus saccharolyticus JOP 1030-1]
MEESEWKPPPNPALESLFNWAVDKAEAKKFDHPDRHVPDPIIDSEVLEQIADLLLREKLKPLVITSDFLMQRVPMYCEWGYRERYEDELIEFLKALVPQVEASSTEFLRQREQEAVILSQVALGDDGAVGVITTPSPALPLVPAAPSQGQQEEEETEEEKG